MTSRTAPGVIETYATFADIARDVVDARVWGGVHWRTSCTRGLAVGRRIGRLALGRFPSHRHRGDPAGAVESPR